MNIIFFFNMRIIIIIFIRYRHLQVKVIRALIICLYLILRRLWFTLRQGKTYLSVRSRFLVKVSPVNLDRSYFYSSMMRLTLDLYLYIVVMAGCLNIKQNQLTLYRRTKYIYIYIYVWFICTMIACIVIVNLFLFLLLLFLRQLLLFLLAKFYI